MLQHKRWSSKAFLLVQRSRFQTILQHLQLKIMIQPTKVLMEVCSFAVGGKGGKAKSAKDLNVFLGKVACRVGGRPTCMHTCKEHRAQVSHPMFCAAMCHHSASKAIMC